MSELSKIWRDQEDFNLNFFPTASTFDEQSRQTKEFTLCVMSELDELLSSINWKTHRRKDMLPNLPQVKSELTDILKYWISLCIVWGITPEEAMQDYWRKSMVCRQRYAEEFVQNLEGEIVLCDIDGVLANYYEGFTRWIYRNRPTLEVPVERCWLNAKALGVHEQVWQELKHAFRTSRGKVNLPVYDGAKEFLDACRKKGYKIVLLTSRPIDRYPNLYQETLEWLQNNDLPYDFVWWAIDKGEKILSQNIGGRIKFALDDDPKYVARYKELGIPCHFITPSMTVKDLIKEVV